VDGRNGTYGLPSRLSELGMTHAELFNIQQSATRHCATHKGESLCALLGYSGAPGKVAPSGRKQP
jgi:hypothetical protein